MPKCSWETGDGEIKSRYICPETLPIMTDGQSPIETGGRLEPSAMILTYGTESGIRINRLSMIGSTQKGRGAFGKLPITFLSHYKRQNEWSLGWKYLLQQLYPRPPPPPPWPPRTLMQLQGLQLKIADLLVFRLMELQCEPLLPVFLW